MYDEFTVSVRSGTFIAPFKWCRFYVWHSLRIEMKIHVRNILYMNEETAAMATTNVKMKCEYWKQLHGTMGLLKWLQATLFAFAMVVVGCHYLWCDNICLAILNRKNGTSEFYVYVYMDVRQSKKKLHAWIMNAAHGVRRIIHSSPLYMHVCVSVWVCVCTMLYWN